VARSFLFSIFFALSSPGAPMHAPINQTRLPKKEKRRHEDTKRRAPSTVRPLARDVPRVLVGWPLPLGFGLDGRLLLARRGWVSV
jgi:hypothetical protein